MSTLSTSPALSFRDSTPVDGLRRDDTHTLLPRLNEALHTCMSTDLYERIRAYCATSLRRDPTAGELRLLDALNRQGQDSPARIAPGQITTDSPELAETWADMMLTHGTLHGVGSALLGGKAVPAPPCSLMDALALTGVYTIRHNADAAHTPLLLSSPCREAEASANGYTPVARLTADGAPYSLWQPTAIRSPSAPRKGDFLLYLPRVTPTQMQTFLAEQATDPHPFSFDVRAVASRPLLHTLWELCPGADLHADRLPLPDGTASPDGSVPTDALCAFPTVAADGICNYLLRVPVKQVHRATAALQKQGITPVICGQVRGDDRIVIRVREGQSLLPLPAVNLPSSFLASVGGACLTAYSPAVDGTPLPDSSIPPVTRLPSPQYPESGLTPDGAEAVALTRHEGQILTISEAAVLLTPLSVTVTVPHTAYRAAANAVRQVTDTLATAGVSPFSIALSVTVTVPSSQNLTCGDTLAAICGIYRAAAERGIPVREPAIAVDPSRDMTLRMVAYAQAPTVCSALSSLQDRQWKASGHPVHKESPLFLFPVLRRSYEDCLKALAAALNRNEGAGYALCPVAMRTVEVEVEVEPATEDTPPVTRRETRLELHPASVAQLVRRLGEWSIPIFCMSEEDTRALLSSPDVAEALMRRIDAGYTVIVLGASCKPFAEQGFLPAVVATAAPLTHTAPSAEVTYAFPAEPSVRLLRNPLMAISPEGDAPSCLMTLRLPDGTAVPDGFTGREGKVLGILNGVDTALLPLLRQNVFSTEI